MSERLFLNVKFEIVLGLMLLFVQLQQSSFPETYW